MEQRVPKHEKIKFRREEITGLHTYPSAAGQTHWNTPSPLFVRAARLIGIVGIFTAAIAVLAVAIVYFVGISGISSERLRGEAETAFEELLGTDVDVSLGPARISFDRSQFLGIEVSDVHVALAGKPRDTAVAAGSIRFGLRLPSLLRGRVQLGSATIANAEIVPASLPSGDDKWLDTISNSQGLVDPDRLTETIFGAVHQVFNALDAGSTRTIRLEDVTIKLAAAGKPGSVRIAHATLARSAKGALKISAEAIVDGRSIALSGAAGRNSGTGRVTQLDLRLSSPAVVTAKAGNDERGAERPFEPVIGSVELDISGQEGLAGESSRLSVSARLDNSVVWVDAHDNIAGSLALTGSLVTGSGKFEIERAAALVGRSRLAFHGAIGPDPLTGDDDSAPPRYRYELVSDGSTVAPAGSPEPALDVLARLAGTFQPAANRLAIDELGIRTPGGELLGTAAFVFEKGKSPGIRLALNIPEMPTSHVKQLWPWIAAATARRWAMNNLFGGAVTNSNLRYRVAPGRLGNGVPLTRDEVSGHFQISGARFDVTGRIPPMRDAVGAVDFGGNDVDISLSSGTVYLPSGRTVAASDGTLTIREANRPRVVGALDMDVAGEAEAVTELASYEPINAMRYLGMTADEFSGRVSGNVKAEVPLHGVEEHENLDWHVLLDFNDLAVDRPFDGQLVTDAVGSIDVDPTRAVIKAKARLNGAPADIDMVEPFGDSDVKKASNIAITLDDKAREELAPGLSTMLHGPATVRFETETDDNDRRIEADLTTARLDIPWAGWSKGAGVEAKAVFRLATDGNITKLSDFKLTGQSFTVTGDIVLSKGELSSAVFDKAQLNRGDDVRVSIKRSGNGYSVDVRGAMLDARSLVKQYTSDSESVADASGSMTVSLKADVKQVAGFGGERLSGVMLAYSGDGSRVNNLDVQALSANGGKVVIRGGAEGNRRTMEMQSNDAGSIVRFLDLYEHMEGGTIKLALAGATDSPMSGQVDATDFWVVNEPKLASLVSSKPPGDNASLNQAVKSSIDTSRVKFERGFAAIEKAPGSLELDRGVLRGPLIGLIFQGTLYDKRSNMDMTGTFMPAYGLNRIFGEIPLLGQILGNGRDRGLIGVTFRLVGNASEPNLQINPLSVIAPGIFRSIFEFRK